MRPGGLEHRVCPKIFGLLQVECKVTIEHNIVTMVDKKKLIKGCARPRTLLTEGCERVVVLWDENPPWTPEADYAEERCWHIERERILANLREKLRAADLAGPSGVRRARVRRPF